MNTPIQVRFLNYFCAIDCNLAQANVILQEYADIQILEDIFKEFALVQEEVKCIIAGYNSTEQVVDDFVEAERLCGNYIRIRKTLRRLHTLFKMYTYMHEVVPQRYLEALRLIDDTLYFDLLEDIANSLLRKYETEPNYEEY